MLQLEGGIDTVSGFEREPVLRDAPAFEVEQSSRLAYGELDVFAFHRERRRCDFEAHQCEDRRRVVIAERGHALHLVIEADADVGHRQFRIDIDYRATLFIIVLRCRLGGEGFDKSRHLRPLEGDSGCLSVAAKLIEEFLHRLEGIEEMKTGD